MKKLVIRILLIDLSVGLLVQHAAIQSSAKGMANDEQVFRISASTFEYSPSEITVKKGVPVVLELTSQDRHHGFKLPAFQLHADIRPGAVEKVRFVPDKTGSFTFFCDVFCGDGHEDMSGTLKVVE